MATPHEPVWLGTGIGWRPEIAEGVEELPGLDWVEVVSENLCSGAEYLPDSLRRLRARGTTVVPHGVSLGLGGAERPHPGRLMALAERAELLGAPLVTEHIAFVRAGGPRTGTPRMEAGHLLPVPRTMDALDVLCENVRIAQEALPVPLALENIAALVNWPGEELSEGRFLAELVERTGVRLLIDAANLHTNHVNRGEDPATALDELPLEALAYVHVAGGVERDGVWHDTHAHPVTRPVLDVLAELSARTRPPGVLLERDEDFPPVAELEEELNTITEVVNGPPEHGRCGPRRAPGIAPRPARGEPGTREEPEAREEPESREELVRGAAHGPAEDMDGARQRLAAAQAGLLSALVADGPVPPGFDRERLAVQRRALTSKRADVVARVAPELPELLGEKEYRSAFVSYAYGRPLTTNHRQDALDFAEHLLNGEHVRTARTHGELRRWWREHSGPKPPPQGRFRRLLHTVGMR